MKDKLDRRVQRTRQLLSHALIELILEKGYEAVRIQDIAERANLRAATLYLHYRNKEDLLVSTLESMFDDLVERLQTLPQGEAMHRQFQAVFQHVQENRDLYRVLMQGEGSVVVRARVRDYIAAQVAQRILRRLEGIGLSQTDLLLSLDFLSKYVAGSLLALIMQWLEDDAGYSVEVMGEMSSRLILRGILGLVEPQGEQLLPPGTSGAAV